MPSRLSYHIRVEVVKHHAEVDGKSTAVHAAIIAPSSVKIHTYPDIPEYDPCDTILVFPGKDSRSLKHILQTFIGEGSELKKGSRTFPFSTVVFVDSTWNQCHGICQDARWISFKGEIRSDVQWHEIAHTLRLLALPRVELEPRPTMFWRHQKGKPREYLATIEVHIFYPTTYPLFFPFSQAIYYFMVDYHKVISEKPYNGEYDNLLFFFKFMYEKIHQLYSSWFLNFPTQTLPFEAKENPREIAGCYPDSPQDALIRKRVHLIWGSVARLKAPEFQKCWVLGWIHSEDWLNWT